MRMLFKTKTFPSENEMKKEEKYTYTHKSVVIES